MLKLYANPGKAVIYQDILLQKQVEAIVYVKTDDIVVFSGEGIVNEEYCKSQNIPVHYTKHSGGTIVMFPGDRIVIYFTKNRDSTVAHTYIHALTNYLKLSGINADVIDNDVLIDGVYKVASSSKGIMNGISYEGFFMSMYGDNEIISKICTKEQKKIPKGLIKFGFSDEEAQYFFDNFFNNVREGVAEWEGL